MDNEEQSNQEKLPWYHDPLWVRFIPSVSSAIIIGIVAAGIGSCWQHSNWKKQHKISADAVLAKETYNKRIEIFSKAVFVIKDREQNIWSYRAAKREKDEDRQWEYRGKEQQLVCECDVLVQLTGLYFKEHAKVMTKNLEDGFRIYHDIMSELSLAKKADDILTVDDIQERLRKAGEILNKNSKFISQYLLVDPLES